MSTKAISVLLVTLFVLTGCSFSGAADSAPTPTLIAPTAFNLIMTEIPAPIALASATSIFTPSATPIPPVAPNFCADPQVVALIDSLRRAMLNSDGPLFSSLVSPNGMEVRYLRYATAITYTAEQTKFLFETTFEVNWGAEPGSGLDKTGSFHDVIVPELVEVFNTPYTLHCNEIRHGGASYEISWPYDRDFYSIYFAGTDQYGYLDWHTWAAGIEYVNGKPHLYALMQFFWEP